MLISLLGMVGTRKVWAAAQTTTTLAITATSGTVTTITSGSAVTLTATVSAGTTSVTVGQVNFCDATAPSCTDIHLLGTAQLTSAGTASIKLLPSIGSHSYKAVFAGTPHGTLSTTGSTSTPTTLSVTGLWPSATTVVTVGDPGNYTLTATTGGAGNTAPTGSISFLDTSNNNAALGSAPLTAGVAGVNFIYSLNSPQIGAGSLAVADLNGDGIPDIARGTPYGLYPGGHYDAGATALLGDGHGNFTAATTLDLGTMHMSVLEVADFNGDGIPDLLVGDGDPQADTQTVTILLSTGTGTFTAAGSTPTGGQFGSVAIADFNGDGIPDVAVANTTANLITILLGKGDGTLAASSAAPSSTNSTTIATGDFNGDGIPDLVGIRINSNSSSATILLGNGDGTFTPKSPGPATGDLPTSIAVGDFNGDGKADLAFPNALNELPPYGPSTVTILLGNGDGTFKPAAASSIALNTEPSLALVGDFNGDGKADLAISGLIFLGSGTGTFAAPSGGTNVIGAPGNGLAPQVAGDLNGDGITDLVSGAAVTMAATQTATATIQGLAVPVATGTHQVAASYDGDSSYDTSISGPVALAAAQGTPTVAVTSSISQITTGTQVTLTATVSGSGLTPTGSVNFYAGSALLGAGTLNSSGVAMYTTTSLPVGNNNITASYGGDTNYTPANSPATVVVVAPPGTATPTVTVTPSASNVTDQQNVMVTVAVAGGTGQPTPTGVLALATGTYNAQQPLANGAASFTIAAGVLSSGSNTLTVTYLGDATYKSVNQTTTVTVSRVLIAASTPASIAPGATATATTTLSAGSTYSGTMKLACTLTNSPSGAQSLPTCSLNPTSVAIVASGNGTATLTLQTTAATNTALAQPSRLGLWGLGGSSVFAGLVMLGMPSRRRRWMSMLGLLLIVCTVGAIGCGGGSSSSKSPTPPTTPATTAGNYTFTVAGTDTADSTITVSTTVTLTVQ